ncbi:MAG: c-di-GMP-binding flagellar brake protein YcgR [Nonlabens sp.]|jgi:c-di-GMP-binding flagellar brake protein YcgR
MDQQSRDRTGGADPLELVVVQRVDGFPAHLRRLPDGSLELQGVGGDPLPALSPGERLRVTRPVPGDATYVQPARVLDVGEDDGPVIIKTGGAPERDQQRQFVRVITPPIGVVLIPEHGHSDASGGSLRDLSAGGVRAVLDGDDLAVGTSIRVGFDLPHANGGHTNMELQGEVVWIGTLGDDLPAAGIQFGGTDKRIEVKLIRWVFQQEARNAR